MSILGNAYRRVTPFVDRAAWRVRGPPHWTAALVVGAVLSLAGCGGGGSDDSAVSGTPPPAAGAPTSAATAAAIAGLASETTRKTIDFQPFPFMIRGKADAAVPEVGQLVGEGTTAVEGILDAFRRPPGLTDDVKLSLLAYALEKIGDRRAVPVLAAWLDQYLFTGSTGWTADFVTHAIKTLQHQPGANTTQFTYLVDEKFDALLQALRADQTTAAGRAPTRGSGPVLHGVVDRVLSPQQKNACQKTIHVTGINAAGQEVTVNINYRTVVRDLNQLLGDPSFSAEEKAAAGTRLIRWAQTDGQIFGGSDYVSSPTSTITDASNCGGSVIERLLSQLNPMLGIPVSLARGQSTASSALELAKTFGNPVELRNIDPLTVIAFEKGGNVGHVELPVSVTSTNAVVQSKFDYGELRFHTVDFARPVDESFRPVIFHLGAQPWFLSTSGVNTTFHKIDPTRIRRVVVSSAFCACDPDDPDNIPVRISAPTTSETANRVVTIEGSAGTGAATIVSTATLLVNNVAQNIAIANGGFQAQVVLRSGDNDIQVSVEGIDGKRGCATRRIRSTTAKTTLSVTLTWALGDADVDLYVTQPDNQTAWYSNKTTNTGGRLDVDNTSGFGPENYFINLAADSALRTGTFSVRVHYFRDRQQAGSVPSRPVNWRVVTLLDEGTPKEQYRVQTGTLSVANPNNASPGASGPDWAIARELTIETAGGP